MRAARCRPVEVTWSDGGLLPPSDELEDDDQLGQSGNGIIFIGDKGKIMCPGWGGAPKLLPISRMDQFQRPAKTLARSNGHHRDWLDACKGGTPASSNFEYGAKLTEFRFARQRGLAHRQEAAWDAANMKAKNAPEADKH